MNKKSTFKKMFLACLMGGLSFMSFGQLLLNEGFEGTTFPPTGWTTMDEDGDGRNWNDSLPAFVGNAAGSYSWNGDIYTPDNWLVTPALTITDAATDLDFSAFGGYGVPQGGTGDLLEVYVSTAGTAITDFTSIHSELLSTEEWIDIKLSLASYVGQTIYIAFRHHNSVDQWFVALDDVVVAPPYTDVAVSTMSYLNAYTSAPESQGPRDLRLRSIVANVGNQDVPSYTMNTFIYKDPDYTTPIKTYSTPGTNLMVDSTVTIEVGPYNVTAAGTYVAYNVITVAGDAVSENDSMTRMMTISSKTFARDNGTNDGGGVTVGDSSNVFLGTTYTFTKAAILDSVRFVTGLDTVGGKLKVQLFNVVGGIVDSVNVYGESADIVIDQAFVDQAKSNGSISVITVPVKRANGDPVIVYPGSYVVGVLQDSLVASPVGMELQMSSGSLAFGALMYRSEKGAFYDLYALGAQFYQTPMVRSYISDYNGPVITSDDSDNTICSTDSITLKSNFATGNAWSTGETTESIVVKTAGSYTLTVGGITTEPIVVTVLTADEPGTTATDPTSCGATDGAIDISLPGAGDGTVYWSGTTSGSTPGVGLLTSISGLAAGGYVVTYDNGTGCLSTDHVVTLNDPGATTPTINVGGPITFCEGGSVTLTSSAVGNNTWSNAETTDAITVSTSGNYFVVNNLGGCSATSAAVKVTVNALPAVKAGADLSICNGQSVTLNAAGASTYVWDSGVTNGVAFSPVATGNYIVTGTDGKGCVNTDTVTVVVGTPPTVTFDALAGTCNYYGPVALVAIPAGGDFTGTGVAGSNFNPNGLAAGTYTINYSVVVDGCEGTGSQIIVVDSCLSINEFDQERLAVYPNPSNGKFTVSSDNLNEYNVIELHDQLGRVVGSWNITAVSMNIETKEIQNGNYLLVIKGEKGRLVKQLVIMD